MTATTKAKPVKILNPRYAGASPEDVGRALMKHQSTAAAPKAKPQAATKRRVQSGI